MYPCATGSISDSAKILRLEKSTSRHRLSRDSPVTVLVSNSSMHHHIADRLEQSTRPWQTLKSLCSLVPTFQGYS